MRRPTSCCPTTTGTHPRARRRARQMGRPVLLSKGRHARLHDRGVRIPRLRSATYTQRDAEVWGVSILGVGSKAAFKAKFGLPFTLLADEDHAVAEQYGTWVEKHNYGKTYMGIQRATFLVDPDGKIARAGPRSSRKGTPPQVLRRARRGAARAAVGPAVRAQNETSPVGGDERCLGAKHTQSLRSRNILRILLCTAEMTD